VRSNGQGAICTVPAGKTPRTPGILEDRDQVPSVPEGQQCVRIASPLEEKMQGLMSAILGRAISNQQIEGPMVLPLSVR
ncbi:MAG: hypothetical protein ACFFGZ_18430, partial [Candidatus Thorarchaeota archaeon]